VLGCGVVAAAIWLRFAYRGYVSLLPQHGILSLDAVVLLGGVIIFIAAFLGCCGAWCKNQCLLTSVKNICTFWLSWWITLPPSFRALVLLSRYPLVFRWINVWCTGFHIQRYDFIHTEARTPNGYQTPLQCFSTRWRNDSCMGSTSLSVQLLRRFIVWRLVQNRSLAQPELCPTFMLYSWVPTLRKLWNSDPRGDFDVLTEGLLSTGGNVVPGSSPFCWDCCVYSSFLTAVWTGVVDGAVLCRSPTIWIQDVQSGNITAPPLKLRHSVSKAQNVAENGTSYAVSDGGNGYMALHIAWLLSPFFMNFYDFVTPRLTVIRLPPL